MCTESESAPPRNVQVIAPTGREHWLELRRQDVTASQGAAVLGLHPYKSRLELFLEKSGRRLPNDDLDSPAMRRGRKLERLGYAECADAVYKIDPAAELSYNEYHTYYRDPGLRIGATPDVIATSPRGRGVIQLKSIEPSIYKRTWHDGEPPLWIAIQALIEAKLTGATWAAVGALRVGHAVDFDLTEIPITDHAWQTIADAVVDFWQLVELGVAPAPDWTADSALIAALAGPSDGTAIDLSGDNALAAALHDREECKILLAGLEKQIKEHDAQIKFKMGAAENATCGDFRITAKTTEYAGYTVAPRQARPIRIKRIRGEAPAYDELDPRSE